MTPFRTSGTEMIIEPVHHLKALQSLPASTFRIDSQPRKARFFETGNKTTVRNDLEQRVSLITAMLVIGLVASVVGCKRSRPLREEVDLGPWKNTDWQTYVDPKKRFTCSVPPEWQQERLEKSASSQLKVTKGGHTIWVTVRSTQKHRMDEDTRDEMLKNLPIDAMGGDAEIIDEQWMLLAGSKALRIDAGSERNQVFMRMIKAKRNGWDHVVTLFADPSSQKSELGELFKTFLDRYDNDPTKIRRIRIPMGTQWRTDPGALDEYLKLVNTGGEMELDGLAIKREEKLDVHWTARLVNCSPNGELKFDSDYEVLANASCELAEIPNWLAVKPGEDVKFSGTFVITKTDGDYKYSLVSLKLADRPHGVSKEAVEATRMMSSLPWLANAIRGKDQTMGNRTIRSGKVTSELSVQTDLNWKKLMTLWRFSAKGLRDSSLHPIEAARMASPTFDKDGAKLVVEWLLTHNDEVRKQASDDDILEVLLDVLVNRSDFPEIRIRAIRILKELKAQVDNLIPKLAASSNDFEMTETLFQLDPSHQVVANRIVTELDKLTGRFVEDQSYSEMSGTERKEMASRAERLMTMLVSIGPTAKEAKKSLLSLTTVQRPELSDHPFNEYAKHTLACVASADKDVQAGIIDRLLENSRLATGSPTDVDVLVLGDVKKVTPASIDAETAERALEFLDKLPLTKLTRLPAYNARRHLMTILCDVERRWRSVSGHTVEATLQHIKDRDVTLKKKDGSVITVPFDDFIYEDQQIMGAWVNRHAAQQKQD